MLAKAEYPNKNITKHSFYFSMHYAKYSSVSFSREKYEVGTTITDPFYR